MATITYQFKRRRHSIMLIAVIALIGMTQLLTLASQGLKTDAPGRTRWRKARR